jgi:hypothetical protein
MVAGLFVEFIPSQVSRLDGLHGSMSEQLLYAPLHSADEVLSAAAVSSSGQFLAVGTSAGTVGQFVKTSPAALEQFHQSPAGQGTKVTALYRVNEVGYAACLHAERIKVVWCACLTFYTPILNSNPPFCWPFRSQLSPHSKVVPTIQSPMLSLSPEALVLGSAYVLNHPQRSTLTAAEVRICYYFVYQIVLV